MEELRPVVGWDDKLRNAKRIVSNRVSVNPLLRDWIRSLQQVLDRLSFDSFILTSCLPLNQALTTLCCHSWAVSWLCRTWLL